MPVSDESLTKSSSIVFDDYYDAWSRSSSASADVIDLTKVCSYLPCCMSEEDSAEFGHHVSIFMVALVAFATFVCVTMILILVFVLG